MRPLQTAGLGEVYIASFDVVLERHPVFVPDLVFIRTEHLGIVTERNVSGAPDLVVEVLSDSTRDVDLGRKLRAYGKHGVTEYWVVDPEANTVEVYRHDSGALADKGTLGLDASVEFLGTTIRLTDILA